VTGIIFDLADFSTADGPGIRTVIFFKGCPLSCRWCSNPESQHFHPEPLYHSERCLRCQKCLDACPLEAIRVREDLLIDRTRCRDCTSHPCIEACPNDALKLAGRVWSSEEVMAKILPQRLFYQNSGGGITFSGGEPMAQPHFAFALAAQIKDAGLHLGLETCGWFTSELDFDRFQLFDFIYFDLKHFTSDLHQTCTGDGNEPIIRNLRSLCQSTGPKRITLCLPLIPGVNDQEPFFHWIIGLAKELGITQSRIIPYHEFGRTKYAALGRNYPCDSLRELTDYQITTFATLLRTAGISCEIVGRDHA